MLPNFSKNEEMEMWLFLRRKLKNLDNKKLENSAKAEMWAEFKLSANSNKTTDDYAKRFNFVMAPNLHKSPFSAHIKIELYYGLNIPVEKEFSEFLKGAGELELDNEGCILKFKESRENGIQFGGDSNLIVLKEEVDSQLPEITIEEQIDIWKFLLDEIKNSETKDIEKLKIPSKFDLWRKFQSNQNIKRSVSDYEKLFTFEMSSSLHSAPLDKKEKVELYYGLSIPVEQRFLRMLQRNAIVNVDNCQRILQYSDDDGLILGYSGVESPKIPEKPQKTPKNSTKDPPFTAQEEMYMWLFLLQKVRNPATGTPEKLKNLPNIDTWKKFKGSRYPKDYMERYNSTMINSLHLASLVKQIKLELYYGLDLQVNEQFLKELEGPQVTMELKNGRLIKYEEIRSDGKIFELGPPEEDLSDHGKKPKSRPKIGPKSIKRCKSFASFGVSSGEESDEYKPYYNKKQVKRKKKLAQKRQIMLSSETSQENEPESSNAYYQRQANDIEFDGPDDRFPDDSIERNDQPESSSAYYTRRSISVSDYPIPRNFTPEEEREMWIFLLSKIRDLMTGKAIKSAVTSNLTLWEEFKDVYFKTRPAMEYLKRFDLVMSPAIHLTPFVRQTKLELYFGLNIHVDEGFLEECRKDGTAIVDEEGCLVSYEDNREDGNKFELKSQEENGFEILDQGGSRRRKALEDSQESEEWFPKEKKKKKRIIITSSSDESPPPRHFSNSFDFDLEPRRIDTNHPSTSTAHLDDLWEPENRIQSDHSNAPRVEDPEDSDEEGPVMDKAEYLRRLKEAISVIGMPELDILQKEIDEKIQNSRDSGKGLTVKFIRRLVESSFSAASIL